MNTKTYIINEGEGKYSVTSGNSTDPGFLAHLEGKDYFERVAGEPMVEDDPAGFFQAAYELSEGKLVVNMEKAKDGYLEWLKELREVKLEELDVDQIKALGKMNFNKIEEIEKQKQALRDLPDLINWESVETIYDLMHIFPPILQ